MEILIGAGVFFFTLLVIFGGYFFIKKRNAPEARKVKRRLTLYSMFGHREKTTDLLKKKNLSDILWLNSLLTGLPFMTRLQRLLEQAAISYPPGVFLLLSILLFIAGPVLSIIFGIGIVSMMLPSVLFAAAPFLFALYKRKKRMEKFERQLPDALELIARSLKAGHAFTGGMKIVADELGDPIGAEFGKALDEINFGTTASEALINLMQRVDCDDLKFFVVSVIIQRETGGNLIEILENIGFLIKERFRFHGRIQALSAEGKLSAMVLIAMPFFVAGFFSIARPEYIGVLLTDEIGRLLAGGAIVMMAFGILVMKKLVSIKV